MNLIQSLLNFFFAGLRLLVQLVDIDGTSDSLEPCLAIDNVADEHLLSDQNRRMELLGRD